MAAAVGLFEENRTFRGREVPGPGPTADTPGTTKRALPPPHPGRVSPRLPLAPAAAWLNQTPKTVAAFARVFEDLV